MLHRFLYLTCNFCGRKTQEEDMQFLDALHLRFRLKRDGWLNKGTRDVCPACVAKGVRP